ncbi:MAG: alkene reductase [Sterolibacteriaceae bacterium MAG5]|nr:alkene reductase [Candidatus Nitricoxidireducens bremensis]
MLFDPISCGPLRFANRIVMAPMTRCRCDHRDAVPNDMVVEYYRQRAGAGMILSEGVPVSDQARGYLGTAALYTEAQAAGWHKVNEAVHAAGGRIFAQIWHCGRISHAKLHVDGSPPAGPSARAAANSKTFIIDNGVPTMADCGTPLPLDAAGIRGVIDDFVRTARLAQQAGFDGVEIHGANGYLFDQFRCPFINDRTDAYGGSLENRYRLLLETVDAVAAEIDPARICVRQSPYGSFNDMQPDPAPLETYPWLARELDKRNIGFLHIYDQDCTWIHDGAHPLMPALRAAYRGNIIACGGFKREQAEGILARGHADLVAIGKPFISNPDLVARLAQNAELNRWDADTFYAGGEKGYIDYPALAG